MKTIIYIILCVFSIGLLTSCDGEREMSSVDPVNWSKRMASITSDSLIKGKTYLSVYSEIYSETEHVKHDLTATTSIRNTSDEDTVYITEAKYYDTHGKLLRKYFDFPVYVVPMETLEIVIDQTDVSGGSGANFIFEWSVNKSSNEPLFEAIMISTSGQQGLSFSSVGKRIE